MGGWIGTWVSEGKQNSKGWAAPGECRPCPRSVLAGPWTSSQLPGDSCVDATSSTVGGVGPREQGSAQPEDLDVPGPTPGQLHEPRAASAALPVWEPWANAVFFKVCFYWKFRST